MRGGAGPWLTPVISAPKRLRQDDCVEFKPMRLHGKKERKEKRKEEQTDYSGNERKK